VFLAEQIPDGKPYKRVPVVFYGANGAVSVLFFLVRVSACGAVYEYDSLYFFGIMFGKRERNVTAHRMSNEDRFTYFERFEYGMNHIGRVFHRQHIAYGICLAMARKIYRNGAVPARKRLGVRFPHRPVFQKAV